MMRHEMRLRVRKIYIFQLDAWEDEIDA